MNPEVAKLLKQMELDHTRHKLQILQVITRQPAAGMMMLGYLEGYYDATVKSIHSMIAMQNEIRQEIQKQEVRRDQ